MKKFISIVFFFVVGVVAFAQYSNGVLVEKLLQTDTTVIGQKIVYPTTNDAEVTMAKVTIPPGKQTGWHKHKIPVFAYVLEGELTVELENGQVVRYKQNETISEVFDTFHNGYNEGKNTVVLIAVYLGGKGMLLSEKKEN